MTITDFKEIYNKRWTIETNYDKLKNKLETENFSRRRKIIIEQDFYSNAYVFNIATVIKHDVNQQITRQPRKNNKTQNKIDFPLKPEKTAKKATSYPPNYKG